MERCIKKKYGGTAHIVHITNTSENECCLNPDEKKKRNTLTQKHRF